jgi:hypothetical protein
MAWPAYTETSNIEHSPRSTSSNIRKVRNKSYRLCLLVQRIFAKTPSAFSAMERPTFTLVAGMPNALGDRWYCTW